MKDSLQKIFEEKTCPQKNRTASEGKEGGQTFRWITEKNLAENDRLGYEMLEYILSPANLELCLQVRRNIGPGGIDRMEVESLLDYPVANKDELTTFLLRDEYRPNPVRRVELPKDNGQKRQLGIPTVVDRVIQQANAQVLTSIYEPQFSDHSYGLRPKRNAHQT